MSSEPTPALMPRPAEPWSIGADLLDVLARLAASEHDSQVSQLEIDRLRLRVLQQKSWQYRLAGPLRAVRRAWNRLARDRRGDAPPNWIPVARYAEWIATCGSLSVEERAAIRDHVATWTAQPQIAVTVDIEDAADGARLARTLRSLAAQIYGRWALVVRHTPSAAEVAHAAVRATFGAGARATVHSFAGGASWTRDRSIEGELHMRLGAGQTLEPHALYMVAHAALATPAAVLIYSDEDVQTPEGRRLQPAFKAGPNRELMLTRNAIGCLAAYRRDALAELAALPGPLGADPDWLLALRTVWRYDGARIRHLPFVLCHSDGSAHAAAERASAVATVGAFVRESGLAAQVRDLPGRLWPQIEWLLPADTPSVAVIVPTRDRAELLRDCIDGLRLRTDYPAITLVVVDNGSREPETLRLFEELRTQPRTIVVRDPSPFNFAQLCNQGVAAATSEIIVLLNNDVVPVGTGWLREMIAQALRDDVGAVGAKLLYRDGTLQHAGIAIGAGQWMALHPYRRYAGNAIGPDGALVVAREVSAVTGACLAMRRAVWDEVGGMDAGLPVYFNDVDLCLRLRARGYRVVWTPEAVLTHVEGGTLSRGKAARAVVRMAQDRAAFFGKWRDAVRRDPFVNENLWDLGVEHALRVPTRAVAPWRAAVSVS